MATDAGTGPAGPEEDMRLANEFAVDVPLDETWATLLDMRRVATCVPGATLGADGVLRGTAQLRLGPMTVGYRGTARMAEVEEDARRATIEVRAHEVDGPGMATARIHHRIEAGPDGATRVAVDTDLRVTGRPAGVGRDVLEDAAGAVFGAFASRLEREARAGLPAPRPRARRAVTGLGAVTVAAIVLAAVFARRRGRKR
jgi:carbon monoxide dehydrogenase subunit G